MRRLTRRAYRIGSAALSTQQKKSIKTATRRVTPRRARPHLRRVIAPLRPGHGGASGLSGPRSKRERVLDRQVASLSRALWMGFTDESVAELERIRRSDDKYPQPVARAAETLARWYATEKQYDLALDRLVFARTLNGSRHAERFRVLEHHVLTRLGLFDDADELFQSRGTRSPDLRLAQANLRLRQAEAGHLARAKADQDRLELIDWLFHNHSLIPISALVNSSETLEFSSLQTELPQVSATEVANPLVSVVVPAYNAETTLTTSVNSLRAQTVRNIEILIVDDASTDNTATVAKTLAADDPRIKVVRHEQNLGAYGARNTGLANACGTYFTVHDADDWSHPQLLERQLHVLETHEAPGSFSRLARVSPQLEFQLRTYRPMLEPVHWNYTSLLTTTQTLRDMGGWDAVRAHSDSELIERMREYFGPDSLVEADPDVPLSFFLVSGNNLTENADTGLRSVDFGTRREYSEQARFWRRRVFAEDELASYTSYPRSTERSPFFAARSLAPNRDSISQSYDLILGSDLSLLGGTRRCNLAYLDCARKLGLRIGIFNMPRYRSRGSGSIDDSYRELFQFDDVDLLQPGDHASAQALLVHHPPVLRHAFDGYPIIKAAKNFLLVNQLPWQMKDYSEAQYDASLVHSRFADVFGAEPTWISISPRVRRYLEPELPPGALLGEDWYPIVSWADMTPPVRTVGSAAAPVVGRQSRDHSTKWPEDAATLAKCYLADTDFDVRLAGGAKAAREVLGHEPKNWTVYPFDAVSVSDFVESIDIFVHFHHSNYIEEFGRNIAEAMAMGVPCVLPPEYAEIFGDAAVYAEPDDVANTIRGIWSDGERYAEYSRRGAAFVADYCGSHVGVSRVAGLLT